MDLTLLRTYILADQALTALAQEGNDQGIADALNASTVALGLYVDRDTLENFVNVTGIAAKAKLKAEDSQADTQHRIACITLGNILASSCFPNIHVELPAVVGMRQALVAAGVASQAEDDALVALATQRYTSIAQSQWGELVNFIQVSEALLGHRTVGGN